jgi:6-phosphogluconolactonase
MNRGQEWRTRQMAPTSSVRWIGAADATALTQAACQRILATAGRAIAERARFVIVLAGGDTPRGVYQSLRTAHTHWSRWHVYFGDERCLPANDVERNSRMAADAWLDHVPIPMDQIHAIPGELGPDAAALAYAQVLRNVDDFDLVLLGLGADGHTASLFPGHSWGEAPGAGDTLAIFDAPKPPPRRVSLSGARLSRAREVLFLIAGASKRDAVARWRAGEKLPPDAIRPAGGCDVLVDSALLSPDAPADIRNAGRSTIGRQ